MFEHVGTKTTGVGKYKETEHSCVYNCKSKKEAEWLKDHSLYGVVFYASGGEGHIMSVSSKKASKMASFAKGGGTKIIEASQSVACFASLALAI